MSDAFAPALLALCWPASRLAEGLDVLARHSGLAAAGQGAPPPEGDAEDRPAAWLHWAAARLGVEAEPVQFALPDLAAGLRLACPALLTLHDGTALRFLLLLRRRGAAVEVIGPDLRRRRIAVELIRAAAAARFEAPLLPDIDRLLATGRVPRWRRARVRRALLAARLADQQVVGCWLLRLPATAPLGRQFTAAGLWPRLAWVVALLGVLYGLEVGGWALIGAAALEGRLDFGWAAAWLLLLLSGIPLRIGAAWIDAGFALGLGRVLKARLLAGALRLDIDAVRHQGAGQLLGRVMESQALETLALHGGMALVVAALELGFAAWILAKGAGGGWHVLALGAWFALTLAWSLRYGRRLGAWSDQRLELTHTLVEQMVGHRTRLAQEWPARRDAAEDAALSDYLRVSQRLDRSLLPIAAGPAGGWAMVALLGLAPAFIAGSATPAAIGISLGGIMLANRAFGGIAGSVAALAQAGVAWRLVRDLFRAGARADQPPALPPAPPMPRADAPPLVDASGLVFRYRAGGRAVLDGLDLQIRAGDRVLLEGPSGGGKSTLAALLTGLRAPEAGLLLLDGLDRPTLGDDWHGMATAAPQFHENHILSGTLAFNLLMGRAWPAPPEDLALAEALCRELDLGELLDRMPAGLQQQVGETGWQLSHGERSRIFLARALLQDAPLTILDESFAALDPETLRRCLETARARARTLVVVAHP